ncbi:MAG: hypothetical protein OXI88_00955 [Gammaproteobacteria bacterium]|nr:hypothetical protein [Gammaproteobacteria bacterium]
MAQSEQVEQLHQICQDCTSKPVTELITNPGWGTINFEAARPKLELAFQLFNDLLQLPVEILPDNVITNIISSAEPLSRYINDIKGFTLQGDVEENRDDIVDNLNNQIDAFYTEAQHWIPYLAYQQGDVQRRLDELSGAVDESDKILTNAKKEAETKKSEIDNVVTAAKEASASVGVAHFSSDFMAEAEKLEKSAESWLLVTGGFTLVTLIVAYVFLHMDEPSGLYSVIYHSTTKLIILGTLIAATVWCGKIYRALRHQVTTNKHRANAIRTFQAFSKAASDDAARDAVLMETTKAIFGLSPSGYLDQETAGSEQTRIIELLGRTSKPHLSGTGE